MLLVANRGEIARRVFATCRRLGIETVAVHSDADAGLPYVREADIAVHLPGQRAGRHLPARRPARRRGPACGCRRRPPRLRLPLRERRLRPRRDRRRPDLGRPDAGVDRGDGLEGRGPRSSCARPACPSSRRPAEPTEADLPAAGEGVRGRRWPRDAGRPHARRPARRGRRRRAPRRPSAFGDGTVFVEPYVERGRHVEVQVVGPPRPGVLVLGERDCSVQRRHQKVVEESPAPRLPDRTRAALHDGRARRGGRDRLPRRRHRRVPLRREPPTASTSWR